MAPQLGDAGGEGNLWRTSEALQLRLFGRSPRSINLCFVYARLSWRGMGEMPVSRRNTAGEVKVRKYLLVAAVRLQLLHLQWLGTIVGTSASTPAPCGPRAVHISTPPTAIIVTIYSSYIASCSFGIGSKHKMGYDVDVVGGYDFGMFRLEGELAYKKATRKGGTFTDGADRVRCPRPHNQLVGDGQRPRRSWR